MQTETPVKFKTTTTGFAFENGISKADADTCKINFPKEPPGEEEAKNEPSGMISKVDPVAVEDDMEDVPDLTYNEIIQVVKSHTEEIALLKKYAHQLQNHICKIEDSQHGIVEEKFKLLNLDTFPESFEKKTKEVTFLEPIEDNTKEEKQDTSGMSGDRNQDEEEVDDDRENMNTALPPETPTVGKRSIWNEATFETMSSNIRKGTPIPPKSNDEPKMSLVPLTRTQLKIMTVVDLRTHCKARGISQSGVKAELVARLHQFSLRSSVGVDRDPFETMSKQELQEACKSRNLPISGNKADLLERLQNFDLVCSTKSKRLSSGVRVSKPDFLSPCKRNKN
eukprot:CAMPEP_0118680934 /NCGR_PEP_ID=MMETSP0800-20121206/4652_1 /TAXON_ID=210618 ORGANISM="Striatella unipunctata, Strain CCMP2910" /NCGR_SAMPLE_ID=MMETSP0800 /ASSEMBLY_ACC=CAM_ASM_000638 /LENGTH=337 /DNA_ID=CAMNT_0006577161 /DNA_START=51 /DNA_END=1064 /DNA_ORIENTATION=-